MTPNPSDTVFDRDTDVTPLGDGRYSGRIGRSWWIVRGPNGGFLAAMMLRAMTRTVDDDARAPRSLTVHFLRPPQEGPVEIETRVERRGRTLSTVTARMHQGEKLLLLAVGAFATARESLSFQHAVMPEAPPPESLADPRQPSGMPFRERFEERWAIGDLPWSGGPKAESGGWIRLSEPRALDAPVVTLLADAWPPAVFSATEMGALMGGVPTVDLTVHFRTPLPPESVAPGDWVLVVFRSREARDGFVEEDGEIWSRDGVLIAQSRQLAVVHQADAPR